MVPSSCPPAAPEFALSHAFLHLLLCALRPCRPRGAQRGQSLSEEGIRVDPAASSPFLCPEESGVLSKCLGRSSVSSSSPSGFKVTLRRGLVFGAPGTSAVTSKFGFAPWWQAHLGFGDLVSAGNSTRQVRRCWHEVGSSFRTYQVNKLLNLV